MSLQSYIWYRPNYKQHLFQIIEWISRICVRVKPIYIYIYIYFFSHGPSWPETKSLLRCFLHLYPWRVVSTLLLSARLASLCHSFSTCEVDPWGIQHLVPAALLQRTSKSDYSNRWICWTLFYIGFMYFYHNLESLLLWIKLPLCVSSWALALWLRQDPNHVVAFTGGHSTLKSGCPERWVISRSSSRYICCCLTGLL